MLSVHMMWGVIIGRIIKRIKASETCYYLPSAYIILGFLLYPVVMLPITDAFRHIVSIPFIYTLFSIYIVQRFFVKKLVRY